MKKLLVRFTKIICKSPYLSLLDNFESPRETQLKLLRRILRNSTNNAKTIEEFNLLPTITFEDIKDPTNLTIENVKFYETTSGSGSSKKNIPYTKNLIRTFTKMFQLWTYDFLQYGPKLSGGSVYFSISPQFTSEEKKLEDDSDYLTGITSFLFSRFILVPHKIKNIDDPFEFKFILSLYLLSAKELEVISIWSPSYFLSLLKFMTDNRIKLLKTLKDRKYDYNKYSFSFPITSELKLTELEKQSLNFEIIFNNLKCISTWREANSRIDFTNLKIIFPKVFIQPKGLLATEAAITIPSIKHDCFLPLIDSVFMEFISQSGEILMIDELVMGEEYELIITQQSGLLRYRLGDIIQVTGKVNNTPCFDFIKRAGAISDLVGEKIHEDFLTSILNELNISSRTILIPSIMDKKYYCISQSEISFDDIQIHLEKNPHYRNVIKLGQLNCIEGKVVSDLELKINSYLTRIKKMNPGDIKRQNLFYKELDNKMLTYLLD
jgi:hypothetical protein